MPCEGNRRLSHLDLWPGVCLLVYGYRPFDWMNLGGMESIGWKFDVDFSNNRSGVIICEGLF